jgi:hypothetical protein
MPPKKILKINMPVVSQPPVESTEKRGRPKKIQSPEDKKLENISKPKQSNQKTPAELAEIRKNLNLGKDVNLTPTGRISKAQKPASRPEPKPMSQRNFPKTKTKSKIPARPGDGRYEKNKDAKEYYQLNKEEINKKRREKYALTAVKKDKTPKWTPAYRLQYYRDWHKVNPNNNGSYDPAYHKEYRDQNWNKLQQYSQAYKSGKIKPRKTSNIVVDPPPKKKKK